MHLHHTTPKRRVKLAAATSGAAVIALCALGFAGGAQAADADTPVQLGTTARFAVLAGAGITNTGTTTIDGDIGSFPTTDMTLTGVSLGTNQGGNGTNQGGNGVTQGAKQDLVTAYDDAAGALPVTSVETELAGKTLVGGVYKAATALGLNGTLTLDGGQPDNTTPSDSVFIFQAGTTLITGSGSDVVLTGGAQACNIFWQVGSSAVFGTGTEFVGTVMAYTEAIVAKTGATFVGRLLARDAAVTLDNNTITSPECAPIADDTDDGDTGDGAAGDTDTPADKDAGTGTDADTDDAVARGTERGTTGEDLVTGADTPVLPDTGGPSWILLPVGALVVLAGWKVLTGRPRAKRTNVR